MFLPTILFKVDLHNITIYCDIIQHFPLLANFTKQNQKPCFRVVTAVTLVTASENRIPIRFLENNSVTKCEIVLVTVVTVIERL
jgi:Mlc titration factor MtfA (ptsG expression regulator)